ncbi:hypothetical protein LPJ72_006084 [Coemansia sp. Benny D160-2]|nr:hypothetical protein LPJ72_006084 [Coemansia sp. Benny D160-2]
MGSCVSRPSTDSYDEQEEQQQQQRGLGGRNLAQAGGEGIAAGSSVDFGGNERWNSEQRLTRSGLERQRNEFWETAPYYGGRKEIWQALRVASESTTDTQLASAILDSIGVTVPTGRFVDGAYDDRGVCYRVPQYCINEPANLAETDDGWSGKSAAASSASVSASALASRGEQQQKQRVVVRLCAGGDVELALAPDTTVAQIQQQLVERGHVMADARVRVFYLGRMLAPAIAPVRDMRLPGEAVLQAMYT